MSANPRECKSVYSNGSGNARAVGRGGPSLPRGLSSPAPTAPITRRGGRDVSGVHVQARANKAHHYNTQRDIACFPLRDVKSDAAGIIVRTSTLSRKLSLAGLALSLSRDASRELRLMPHALCLE